MFIVLSKWIYRGRWPILGASAIFLLIAGLFAGGLFDQLKGGGFAVYDAESTQASLALHQDLGQAEGALVVLFTAQDEMEVDSPPYQQAVAATLARIQDQPGVGAITMFYTTSRPQFVSQDRRSTYAVVGLLGDDNKQQATMQRLRPLLTSDRLQVRLTGYPAWLQDNNDQIKQDLATADSSFAHFQGGLPDC